MIEVWNIEPSMKTSDIGSFVCAKKWAMRVAGMKVDYVEGLGCLHYLCELKGFMSQRLHDVGIEPKSPFGTSD